MHAAGTAREQAVDLILHQRNQRRDNDGQSSPQTGWHLVTQRLAATSRQNNQRAPTVEYALHRLCLKWAEGVIAPVFCRAPREHHVDFVVFCFDLCFVWASLCSDCEASRGIGIVATLPQVRYCPRPAKKQLLTGSSRPIDWSGHENPEIWDNESAPNLSRCTSASTTTQSPR